MYETGSIWLSNETVIFAPSDVRPTKDEVECSLEKAREIQERAMNIIRLVPASPYPIDPIENVHSAVEG